MGVTRPNTPIVEIASHVNDERLPGVIHQLANMRRILREVEGPVFDVAQLTYLSFCTQNSDTAEYFLRDAHSKKCTSLIFFPTYIL